MNEHIRTVLDYLTAAQTVLAVYGSPSGPTDPIACHGILVSLLEDPVLLRAQMELMPSNKITVILGEPNTASPVFLPGGD